MPNTYTTDWARAQHDTDNGHRIAAGEAYAYLGHLIKADDTYPLPADADAVIALAATAMQDVHASRQARLEAYAAQRASGLKDAGREVLAGIRGAA